MRDRGERRRLLQSETEKRLAERFAALRAELDRLRAESDGRWAGFAARLEQGTEGIVPVTYARISSMLTEWKYGSELGCRSSAAAMPA